MKKGRQYVFLVSGIVLSTHLRDGKLEVHSRIQDSIRRMQPEFQREVHNLLLLILLLKIYSFLFFRIEYNSEYYRNLRNAQTTKSLSIRPESHLIRESSSLNGSIKYAAKNLQSLCTSLKTHKVCNIKECITKNIVTLKKNSYSHWLWNIQRQNEYYGARKGVLGIKLIK